MPITQKSSLGINFPITHTSVTQKNCFRIICVIISGLIVSSALFSMSEVDGETQKKQWTEKMLRKRLLLWLLWCFLTLLLSTLAILYQVSKSIPGFLGGRKILLLGLELSASFPSRFEIAAIWSRLAAIRIRSQTSCGQQTLLTKQRGRNPCELKAGAANSIRTIQMKHSLTAESVAPKRGRTQKHAKERKWAQKSANRSLQKSAKGRKRAQKSTNERFC